MRQHAFEVGPAGRTIRGTMYLPSDEGRHPCALFLHGFTGQRIEAGFMFVRLGRTLARAGIAAVAFDFRGSGESDGSFDQMLVSGELDDALRMTQWVASLPNVDRSRLGLLGFSLGGLLAACVAGRTPIYRALALLAPTTVANLCRVAGEGQDRPVTVGPHVLHASFFDDLRKLDPLADVVRHPRPTLLVQGTGDTAVAPAVSQEFVDAMRRADVPAAVELVPGADHVFTAPAWRDAMKSAVVGFFTRHLAGR